MVIIYPKNRNNGALLLGQTQWERFEEKAMWGPKFQVSLLALFTVLSLVLKSKELINI